MIEDVDNQVATLKELARKVAETPHAAAETPSVATAVGKVAKERVARRKVPYTMAVTSGKGGVGKTLVSVNLAIAFARQGLKVLVIDADLGLANIDVVLGLTPQYTIQDVLDGGMSLSEVAITGPMGITILPAASGVAELSTLSETQRLSLMDHIDNWNDDFDVVLVDTGAGISSTVRFFVLAVERITVVATPDPASITDAYALMKVMFTNHRISRFDLLVNQAKSEQEAREVYRTLYRVADKFLNIGLKYCGYIPYATHLSQAVRKQKPVTELFPESEATASFDKLSTNLLEMWGENRQNDGLMTFFWRRLLEEDKDASPQSPES
ncbi:MAG: MinD/ParA family protein [Magnetococcales bacterium]|nr:MinD/ParA family protein [Magnetococcales bacterium]